MKRPILYPDSKRIVLTHIAWIIGLSILLLLSGSFALAFTGAQTVPVQRSSVQSHARPEETRTSHIEEQITVLVTPGVTATPSPISNIAEATSSPVYAQQAHPQGSGQPIYHGNAKLPEVALTFDDGPNPPYTQEVLAILQRYGVDATFFCVGRLAQANYILVKQEYAAGHVIGNHSWSHPYLPNFSGAIISWQLSTTSDTIANIIGVRPTFFRPPYGAFNAQVLTIANAQGLSTVIWDVDPRDWSMPGTNVIIARVLSQVHNGAIILMHDGGGNRSQTVAALPTIIATIQQRGYHFVTLPQLVSDLAK
jgi:peptidoglycan-N-acetylglucosamine deacetylase